jgi:hypothetical protein
MTRKMLLNLKARAERLAADNALADQRGSTLPESTFHACCGQCAGS